MTTCYPSTTDWGCAPDEFVAGLDADLKAYAEALAWSSLQALVGYRMSICPVVVRPCTARCAPGSYFAAPVSGLGTFGPYVGADGGWYNSCGCALSACSCTALSEVILPQGVGRIVAVWADGVEVPKTEYRVDDGNRLVSLTDRVWPGCQDMRLGPREDGAFSVEYFAGEAPDQIADRMAGTLAYEFAKACLPGQKCRLPKGVTSVARAGVSMEIRTGLFADGVTGIEEVDAWVYTMNPHRLKSPPTMASPDTLARRPRMQTWGR